jgi:SulP family sulfate permease
MFRTASIVEAYKAGLLAPKHWAKNIIAGVIVGVVALPLSMAFAIASGARPEQGLYTAIVAGLICSVMGGSRVQISGPTGAFIVILAGITAEHGIAGLQIATLMAGIILIVFALTRMGGLIKFIPSPVIVGFTAGIGVIIFIGQWRDFLGLPEFHSGTHFHQKFLALLAHLGHLHGLTTLIGIVSLLLIVYTPKIRTLRHLPGPLVALLGGTLISAVLQLNSNASWGVATIGSQFQGIPQALPHFSLPHLNVPVWIELIGPAFTIAMLCAIESLLSAVVADGMTNSKHHSNQELFGQGLANLAAPLFGGFAATGAIARTATNIRNGGTSPIAGIVHALTIILIILLLAPLAVHIPMASLAAILFVVAWNMSDLAHFRKMIKRAPRSDIAVLLITFGLTVFADLVVAVNIGVILAMLHFMRRMSSSVEVSVPNIDYLTYELSKHGLETLPQGLSVYALDGPVFFGAVDQFERAMQNTASDPQVLILRMRWVPFIDVTGIEALEEVIANFHRRDVLVLLSGANEHVEAKLIKGGIYALVGDNHHFADFPSALEFALEQLKNKAL